MKQPFHILSAVLLALVLTQCSRIHETSPEYEAGILKWRHDRIERLKSKNGWLNLAGLYWLKEGYNSIGSDSSCTIVFPPDAAPFLGSIFLKGDSIWYDPEGITDIYLDGAAAEKKILVSDEKGTPSLLESGSFAWYVIKREGTYAIRLRNYNNPAIEKLREIPSYPVTRQWRIVAEFFPFDSARTLETITVTGRVDTNICPGELVFRKGFRKYTLLPILEGSELFIIFADKTNGIETYGNGRFLYATLPDQANKVILDFNKAYNPPCALTPFANCPMPPRENILDLEVSAGEKEVHLY